jgi:cytochrome c
MRKAALILCVLLVAGCRRELGITQKTVPDGDAAAGRGAIIAYGCGSCHVISGIPDANAYVGPPLEQYARRHYIAGNLPNTVDNLIYWLRFPQSVEPGTAMPNLDVTQIDARNIAAYLYGQ